MMIPKFRAWDKVKEIFTNYQIVDGMLYFMDKHTGAWKRDDKEKSFILMQSTGLQDKNGVEIYEGDILKTFSNINKYTDSFAEDIEPKFEYTTVVRDGACFKTTYKKRPSYVLNEDSGSMVEHMEVIGNIYENPGLLEVE